MSDRVGGTTPLAELSARALRAGYASGAFSPVEVVRALLERIERVNPVLNAHWHVAAESALREAAEATRRYAAGTARPLEGVPVGVKDTIDVAGMPATSGSRLYRDRVPDRDATVVRLIRAAGGIVLTKDATSEFAFGSPVSPLYGFTTNPWRAGHWAGGSSAGGAAGVAARCLPLAVGTDAGGSVRAPASWSGVTGLKPTKGRVSRTGVVSLSWTMCTVGALARTATDAADLLTAMTGYDPTDPQSVAGPPYDWRETHGDLTGFRIGVPWRWAERDADAAEVAALAEAVAVLRAAGATIVDLPTFRFSRDVGRVGYHILHAEAAYALREHRGRAELDPDLVDRINQGAYVTAAGYLDALRFRAAVQRELAEAFAEVDLLAVPTTIGTAPRRVGQRRVEMLVNGRPAAPGGGVSPWTVTFNLTGMPAVAVPAGMADGLPLSFQLVAPPYRERLCVAAAEAFQLRTDHHERVPPLPAAAEPAPPEDPPAGTEPDGDPARLAVLADWFGEPAPAVADRRLAASLSRAAADMRTVRDPLPSGVDGSHDPMYGEAFLRGYLGEPPVTGEGGR